jgi:transposase
MLMVKEDVVEAVLGALSRGEPVLAVARAYGLDPKTVRAWRRRGQYQPRHVPVVRVGRLTPFLPWLEARAPEVAFNAAVHSRRCFAVAFRRQQLREWLAGQELAFQHFDGVPDRVVVDNAEAMVVTDTREAIVWNPTYAYYGVRPRACAPYRPQTKGKVESGVKYVQRNALAGKRFASWDALNAWLLE